MKKVIKSIQLDQFYFFEFAQFNMISKNFSNETLKKIFFSLRLNYEYINKHLKFDEHSCFQISFLTKPLWSYNIFLQNVVIIISSQLFFNPLI